MALTLLQGTEPGIASAGRSAHVHPKRRQSLQSLPKTDAWRLLNEMVYASSNVAQGPLKVALISTSLMDLIGASRLEAAHRLPSRIAGLRTARRTVRSDLGDRASGAKTDRPRLARALDFVREGDVLVTWKVDRLARSLPHLIETVKLLDVKLLEQKSARTRVRARDCVRACARPERQRHRQGSRCALAGLFLGE